VIPKGIKKAEECRASIIVHAPILTLNREGAIRRDELGAKVQDIIDAVLPWQLGCRDDASQSLGAEQSLA
jgi:hypothetical protein